MPYIGNELATQFQAFTTQTITGDGSTGYTLSRAVANGKELLVYINNVKQEEGSGKSYQASGTTITFTEAVASSDSCYVVFLGSAIQTVAPPDGSVSSAKLDTNIAVSGTLGVTGAVTADAGISVDNITIDGTEIDLSSGDFTLDVAGEIVLDADGGNFFFNDGGTGIGRLRNVSSDFVISSEAQDKDIIFKGDDGGSDIEAMRIDMSAGGRLGIGTTGPASKLNVATDEANFIARFYNDGNDSSRSGIFVQAGRDDGGNTTDFFTAYDGDGGHTGSIRTVSGTFQLVDVSDQRLKQDIVDTTVDGLTTIDALQIRDFAYKKNPTETVKAGFIAQELQKVFPDAVSEDNNSDKTLGVSRDRLVPVLIKAVQELSAKVKALESK